ncbi:MAG: FKBP-type peptidyl-prolyl cis-trans isomerase [Candidatus Saccharibacteria bacterium]|nr:FKBP-type peptidyl-prolyl cis-trans isomerase [Candidatus Saccharibacteria bacterium]
MESNVKKTTVRQRVIIFAIALILLGSTIATYAFVVLSASQNTARSAENNAKLTEVEEEYTAIQTEMNDYAKNLSEKYYNTFYEYRKDVKSYNAATVNSGGLTTKDLKTGNGKELKSGDTDYFAYYIGFCADEKIFDSSFDNYDNPTRLSVPIYANEGLIEGWNQGIVGMKINGVREISIPAELAYKEQEICGGSNSPLKFIVMPIMDNELKAKVEKKDEVYSRLIELYYGSGNSAQ